MRLRALLACLSTVVPAVAARADLPAYYADFCGAGSFVAEYYRWRTTNGAYLGDGEAVFARVVETDDATVVCLHVDFGRGVLRSLSNTVGGRIVLTGTRLTPTLPTVSPDVSGCAGLTTLASGQVGDPAAPPYQPYQVAVGFGPDRTDVCLVVNGGGVRLTFPSARVDALPAARFDQDPPGARVALPAMPAVDPAVPSTACYGGGYEAQTTRSYERLRAPGLVVHHGEESQSSGGHAPDDERTCLRVESPAGARGGALRHEEVERTGTLSDADAAATCQVTVFRSEQPVDVHLRRGAEGDRAAVCVTVAGMPLAAGVQAGDRKVDTYEWQEDPA